MHIFVVLVVQMKTKEINDPIREKERKREQERKTARNQESTVNSVNVFLFCYFSQFGNVHHFVIVSYYCSFRAVSVDCRKMCPSIKSLACYLPFRKKRNTKNVCVARFCFSVFFLLLLFQAHVY